MSAAAPSIHRADIDNLRNLAVLAVVLFHTARLFDKDPWSIKDAGHLVWADWIIAILNQWHMPLFMLVAGMSSFFAIDRRGAGRFVRERMTRLFIPVIPGCFILVAPQVYIERIAWFVPNRTSAVDFHGSYLDFLPTFVTTGIYPAGNFSWHHLWFIVYLFVYSIVLAAPLSVWGRGSGVRMIGRGLARAGLWLILPALALAGVRLYLYPIFGSTCALVGDWANHAHFASLFLLGWLIVAVPDLETALRRGRFLSLVSALVVTAIWWAWPSISADLDRWIAGGRVIAYALGEWFWIATISGWSGIFLNRGIPFVTALTRYAFPLYILHQTVIIFLGYAWWGWSDQPVAKFFAVVIVTTAISLIGCRLLDTNPVTRFVIGLKSPHPRAAA